jgi:hypothetical protein
LLLLEEIINNNEHFKFERTGGLVDISLVQDPVGDCLAQLRNFRFFKIRNLKFRQTDAAFAPEIRIKLNSK